MNELDGLDEPFEFPPQILDTISESSPEAFILFVINDNGEVEMFGKSGSEVVDAGIRTKALEILGGLRAIDTNEIAQQLFHQKYGRPPTQDEEEQEEEEED
jgi:hypothetical protein